MFQTRSRFVTYVALISIAVSFYSIIEGFSSLSMQNSGVMAFAQQTFPGMAVSTTATVFEIILNAIGLVSSVGLFMRRKWGRVSYMAVLSVATVWQIYSSISTSIAMQNMMAQVGMEGMLSLVVLWSVIGLGISLYVLWKLNTPDIKIEFEPPVFHHDMND